jgi:hypothetical protein
LPDSRRFVLGSTESWKLPRHRSVCPFSTSKGCFIHLLLNLLQRLSQAPSNLTLASPPLTIPAPVLEAEPMKHP